MMKIHPLVRDLYKRFMVAGRHYPKGLDYVRGKVKETMLKNKDLCFEDNEIEFKKAVSFGRYWVREIDAISKLNKYRYLKNKYY